MAGVHARLGPSSASRWLSCPASVVLSELIGPRPSGPAAEAGVVMHNVFERKMLNQGDFTEEELIALESYDVSELRARKIVSHGVAAANRALRQYKLKEFLTETRVNPGKLIGRSDYWGTADLIAADEKTRTLLVGDLKTGRGRISVVGNEQLLSYACGSLELLDFVPQRVVLAIIQPPLLADKPNFWETTLDTLTAFMQFVKARALLTDCPDTPPQPSESACMWCPAKPICPQHKPV